MYLHEAPEVQVAQKSHFPLKGLIIKMLEWNGVEYVRKERIYLLLFIYFNPKIKIKKMGGTLKYESPDLHEFFQDTSSNLARSERFFKNEFSRCVLPLPVYGETKHQSKRITWYTFKTTTQLSLAECKDTIQNAVDGLMYSIDRRSAITHSSVNTNDTAKHVDRQYHNTHSI